jgi:hypothetical protein
MKNYRSAFFGLALSLLLISCTSLTLKEVQFGWPVESVLTVDEQDRIEDRRYSIVAGVAPIAAEEFQDSTALRGKEIRLLRSDAGFYFITGKRFKHVYVFSPGEHRLTLEGSISVSERGLNNPAMNQRPPYVELLDGGDFRVNLTPTAVVKEGEQE